VAADVCRCLGLLRPSIVCGKLLEDEKGKSDLLHQRGSAPTVVSESGLYKLVMRSDKPEAREFQNWVTREVLPSIRKDGVRLTGQSAARSLRSAP
jgi:prophage antirepressor-like protein